ncbi:MAG: antitoxin Xre/MbcA/ParS toxin-binding domain-containing protein [Marinobacter sp.]
MSIKRMTEKELLADLDADKTHANELAEPLPHELDPLERLRGSVKHYDRPADPVWDESFDTVKRAGDDFMEMPLVLGVIPVGLFDDPKAFVEAVRDGIPGAWLASVVDASGNVDLFASALQMPAEKVRTLFNKQHLDSGLSEVILDVVRLLRLCESIWESNAQAIRWLHLPVAALGGVEPSRLVDTYEGRRWISQVLSKIEQGQFS